jgi:RNase H-fold protein (predicted Holliday junction resolvase)
MSSGKSELRNLSKNDVVVLCGGSLDIARNDSMQGLASISRFVKNLEHTNVVVVDAPHRFDLETSSCVNKVTAFNRKLHKILKPHNHTTQITLRCAIPIVCVTRWEGGEVEQHN